MITRTAYERWRKKSLVKYTKDKYQKQFLISLLPRKRRQSEPYISGGWSPSPALLALRSIMIRTMMKSRCQAPPPLTSASLQTHILHTQDNHSYYSYPNPYLTEGRKNNRLIKLLTIKLKWNRTKTPKLKATKYEKIRRWRERDETGRGPTVSWWIFALIWHGRKGAHAKMMTMTWRIERLLNCHVKY